MPKKKLEQRVHEIEVPRVGWRGPMGVAKMPEDYQGGAFVIATDMGTKTGWVEEGTLCVSIGSVHRVKKCMLIEYALVDAPRRKKGQDGSRSE